VQGSRQTPADHGAWEYEPGTGRTRWSAALYEIHGVSRESFEPTVESVDPLVHPDDRETYAAIVRDAIATKTPFACQHRIVRPDGEARILIIRGSFVEGHDETEDRLIGTTHDVTEQEGESERLSRLASHDTVSGLYNGSTEDELRGAIGGQELRLQYQPIVSLKDGATLGFEALLRWDHPIRGLVGPKDFVSVAEETGLISKIGRFVLERACRQAAEWHLQGHDIFVSVNISPRQLTRADLADDVSRALQVSGLQPGHLCLEFSETSLLRDPGRIVESLRRLKALGVRLAIDDFGAGASSFGILRILPIDQIKIDHIFTQGLGDTTSDRAVVAAVVSLAKELGLSVVAEGVETDRQQAELQDLGTDLAQGYLYAPARNPGELELDGFRALVTPSAPQAHSS
jgi:EAL domain-containing protein (putative c-di-GMP-specific phosphodiesterase class I)